MAKAASGKPERLSIPRRLWRDRISWLMMSPYLFFYVLMILIPAVVSIVLSFTYFNMFSAPKFVGLDNFVRMFMEDDVFMTALSNTLVAAVVIGPIGYLISFVMAWLINDISPRIRWLVTLIFYAPSISGSAYVVWSFILSPSIVSESSQSRRLRIGEQLFAEDRIYQCPAAVFSGFRAGAGAGDTGTALAEYGSRLSGVYRRSAKCGSLVV